MGDALTRLLAVLHEYCHLENFEGGGGAQILYSPPPYYRHTDELLIILISCLHLARQV